MELVSLSTYALYVHKDVGNIRRNLINGRLKGFKIGNQWVIDKNEPYPKDKRVSSNKYKKKLPYFNNELINTSILSIIRKLRNIRSNQILEVILFGSYANNTYKNDSDIDLFLLFKNKLTIEENKKLSEIISFEDLYCGKCINTIDVYEKELIQNYYSPLFQNIQKEGIVLWKKKNANYQSIESIKQMNY